MSRPELAIAGIQAYPIAMAKIRTGSKAALVVVDTQVDVLAQAYQREAVVGNIVDLVNRARSADVPVIWIQHQDDELVPGQPGWTLVPELPVLSSDPVIAKSYNSAFQQTLLEETLARSGVSHVVLCGAATNWCIRATAYSALERGYDLTLAGDAHTTGSLDLGDRTVAAADIVAELNVGLKWVSYPDVRNQVCAASQITFTEGAASTPAR